MIKSGTNNISWRRYWFTQNSAFDARAFFNPSSATWFTTRRAST